MFSRLLGAPARRFLRGRALGLAFLAVGGILLGGAAVYYALSLRAYADFEGLARSAKPDVLARDIPAGWEPVQPGQGPGVPASAGASSREGAARVAAIRAHDGPAVELYPAVALADGPQEAVARGSVPAVTGPLQYVSWDKLPRTLGAAPPARRIQIPAIAVDSKVVEVGTIWVDGKLQWETPKWAVGHHEGTGNPGEVGNAVFSGHISSPLLREGEVFKRLPEVPKLVDAGQAVDIVVWTDEARYLYRVVRWELVKPEAVDVFAQTSQPTATLITCYPDFAYWDRLIITARLVARTPLDAGK